MPENLDLKLSIMKSLDQIVSPDTILESNTSSIPIAQLGGMVSNPERVVAVGRDLAVNADGIDNRRTRGGPSQVLRVHVQSGTGGGPPLVSANGIGAPLRSGGPGESRPRPVVTGAGVPVRPVTLRAWPCQDPQRLNPCRDRSAKAS